jgi:orotidine-5'-phosphate decarboxylase
MPPATPVKHAKINRPTDDIPRGEALMQKKTRIILALDVTSHADALRVVGVVKDYVDAIKINWPLILAAGPDIIREMSKVKDVICDFKISDIPNTNRLIVEQAMSRGASAVICHGFAGEDSVKACVDAAEGQVFVVTEMSHPGGKQFTAPVADMLAAIAESAGARGIVAPATRPERIAALRKIIGNMEIITPGVGAQGGKASDAIRAGADYIIVGRAIYEAADPRDAARKLADEVMGSA